jgi:hypothetical protein
MTRSLFSPPPVLDTAYNLGRLPISVDKKKKSWWDKWSAKIFTIWGCVIYPLWLCWISFTTFTRMNQHKMIATSEYNTLNTEWWFVITQYSDPRCKNLSAVVLIREQTHVRGLYILVIWWANWTKLQKRAQLWYDNVVEHKDHKQGQDHNLQMKMF